MSYAYHVFVSYPRIGTLAHWVPRVFTPMIESHLADELGEPAAVYCDVTTEKPGNRWPESLADAHASSRVIVPILCAGFFRSGWCLSEWSNAVAREEHVRAAGGRTPIAVVPVRFNDLTDEHLAPLDAPLKDQLRARLRADFFPFSALVDANVHSAMQLAHDFRRAVQDLCKDVLAPAVRAAPAQDPAWPRLPQDPISGQDPSWRPKL